MLFFANSQRRESKRYVSIPVSCIGSVNPGKKAGKPVVLHLQPNFDFLSEMKVLHIQFLDDSGKFCPPSVRLFILNAAQTEGVSANSCLRKRYNVFFWFDLCSHSGYWDYFGHVWFGVWNRQYPFCVYRIL